MKNIYVGLLAAVACTYSMQAAANSLNCNNLNLVFKGDDFSLTAPFASHTAISIGLKPISSFNPDNAVKLAAVCSVGGGGCNGLSFGSSDSSMDLDKNFQCTDEGYVKTCPSGYVPDTTQKCPHSSAYFKCRPCINSCDSGYSFTACNSSTQVQTASYKNECSNTCYQCRDKTCAEGGYSASITSCQNGTAVSFANKTCYKDVSAKTCENGGYKSSVPSNNKCDSTTYCSKTCYTNCKQPTCEESGYLSSCPTNHTCTTVTSGTYGRTCYNDGGQPTCEDGGYKSGVPTNYVCTPVSYSGRTCYKDCYQPQCAAGGYVDSCPTNQIGTSVTYYGRNCLKDCYQPQCAAGGYVDACPTGQSGTAVTYYGRNCYKNCVNPCDSRTAVTVPSNASCSSYYSDCPSKCSAWTCNSGYSKKEVPNAGTVCAKDCSGSSCCTSGEYFTVTSSNPNSACPAGQVASNVRAISGGYCISCQSGSCSGSMKYTVTCSGVTYCCSGNDTGNGCTSSNLSSSCWKI